MEPASIKIRPTGVALPVWKHHDPALFHRRALALWGPDHQDQCSVGAVRTALPWASHAGNDWTRKSWWLWVIADCKETQSVFSDKLRILWDLLCLPAALAPTGPRGRGYATWNESVQLDGRYSLTAKFNKPSVATMPMARMWSCCSNRNDRETGLKSIGHKV